MNEKSPDWKRILHVGGTALFLALVLPFVVFALPQLVGAEASYVVLSDSMSPTINAGDAIIVNEVSPSEIEEGDVITFHKSAEADGLPITHRVTEVVQRDGERYFRTRGDANENADQSLVKGENVVGRELLVIPYLGYIVTYANSKVGLVALVILPSLALIGVEVSKLVRGLRGQPDGTETGPTEEKR